MKRRTTELLLEKSEYGAEVKRVNKELEKIKSREIDIVNTLEKKDCELDEVNKGFKLKIELLRNKNDELINQNIAATDSKFRLQKKFAATRKHIIDVKKSVVSSGSSTVTTKSKSVKTNTDLKGTNEPLVKLTSSTSCNFVSIGEKYPGLSSEQSQIHSGKSKYFAELLIRSVDITSSSRQEVWSRAHDGRQLLGLVAASDNQDSEENLKALIVQMMKRRPHIFSAAAEDAGIFTTKMITPDAAVNIQSLLRLTDNKLRDLRHMLKNAGSHVLPSSRQMVKIRKEKTKHVNQDKLESGEMYLRHVQKDKNVTSCPYVKVKDLIEYISTICEKSELRDDPNFNNEIWLLFSGDKGGSSMKFVFSVVNDVKNGSVDNNHIYCMFKASDSLENMWKIFHPYIAQIKEMQSEGFLICGKKVCIFLGGDYHFLDDMLGHGGSPSSYPSHADFVTLKHLQNHGTEKHSIENCGIILRTVEWYQRYYSENRGDDRNNGSMSENAKYHYSVIEKMMFPISDLQNVVPAVLHIVLGVTLRLFNLVETECIKIDGICKTVEEVNRCAMLDAELNKTNLELEEITSEITNNCRKIIEYENSMLDMKRKMLLLPRQQTLRGKICHLKESVIH